MTLISPSLCTSVFMSQKALNPFSSIRPPHGTPPASRAIQMCSVSKCQVATAALSYTSSPFKTRGKVSNRVLWLGRGCKGLGAGGGGGWSPGAPQSQHMSLPVILWTSEMMSLVSSWTMLFSPVLSSPLNALFSASSLLF